MEGLSDHLLALRAVLEGHGPVGASLPLRASALIADDNLDRIEARERVEDTLELERALMNGRTLDRAIELATWIEDGVRRLLREAALGELGADLSATADVTLVATGLEAGDAEITVFAQDDLPEVEETPAEEFQVEHLAGPKDDQDFDEEEPDLETRIMEPIPAEGEIKVTATHWLDEVSDGRPGDSLEWPVHEERDLQHRERIDTPRVRHLFPVPDADWEVSHLEFEHFGRGSAS
jgi:hypothetical protein